MFLAISWLLMLMLLAVWSVSVWMLHAFMAWTMNSAGTLAGMSPSFENLALPTSFMQWIPTDLMLVFESTATMVWPFIEYGVSTLPSIAGWLAPLAWSIWGIGLLTLLAIGAVLHVVIFATQRAAHK